MILIIILVIVVLAALYVMSFYNGCIKLRNQIEEAFSTMDVYLKQRYDLIPNLVNTVKGYTEHESTVLENVINARAKALGARTNEEKIDGDKALESALGKLFALSESYPQLRANENFEELQRQLKGQEDNIANARKYYNAVVREFNTKIQQFPGALFATSFGFTKQYMYEIDEYSQRQNVEVKF